MADLVSPRTRRRRSVLLSLLHNSMAQDGVFVQAASFLADDRSRAVFEQWQHLLASYREGLRSLIDEVEHWTD